jgi:hypothetical protein
MIYLYDAEQPHTPKFASGVNEIGEYEERKMFFFEKKNQKTFASLSRTYPRHLPNDIKVFCFFFSKKKALLLF